MENGQLFDKLLVNVTERLYNMLMYIDTKTECENYTLTEYRS